MLFKIYHKSFQILSKKLIKQKTTTFLNKKINELSFQPHFSCMECWKIRYVDKLSQQLFAQG